MPARQMSWIDLYNKWVHRFNDPEEKLAIQVSKWLYDNYPELLWWHTQNEGKRGWYQQVLARLLGVKAGVPDIFIPREGGCRLIQDDVHLHKEGVYSWVTIRGKYFGFFCELKAGKNKPTKLQKEMLVKLTQLGYYCCVCYSLDEFIKEWTNYVS